jgi:hypothetical protein
MTALEATVKRQDRHFGRLLAPIVGAAASLQMLNEQLQEQKRQLAVLYKGVDTLLKHFDPKGRGMAAIEKEAV